MQQQAMRSENLCPYRLGCSVAYGILVPWPGIEPASPALQSGFLITGPSVKSLLFFNWMLPSQLISCHYQILKIVFLHNLYSKISCIKWMNTILILILITVYLCLLVPLPSVLFLFLFDYRIRVLFNSLERYLILNYIKLIYVRASLLWMT